MNGYFLYAALKTHTGVVANEPYRKGLAYNDRIAADERQSTLGWAAEVEVERSGLVTLTLVDRIGRPVSGQAVSGTIGRPATGHSDHVLALEEAAAGRYVATVSDLAPGAWIVALDVMEQPGAAEPAYRLRRRLWLKP